MAPLIFTDRTALVDSLRGADTFYNTYWVRFRHGNIGFGDAIANTRILVSAAAEAGVRKVVHISVSNPTLDSHLDYYAVKARTEEIVRESGLPWAIVRPTLIFGPGDILINNIAWLLRNMPIFVIPENGRYRVQPVAGEDVADIATWAASRPDNVVVDAAGPEVMTYAEMVDSVAITVHRRPRIDPSVIAADARRWRCRWPVGSRRRAHPAGAGRLDGGAAGLKSGATRHPPPGGLASSQHRFTGPELRV